MDRGAGPTLLPSPIPEAGFRAGFATTVDTDKYWSYDPPTHAVSKFWASTHPGGISGCLFLLQIDLLGTIAAERTEGGSGLFGLQGLTSKKHLTITLIRLMPFDGAES